MILMNVSLDNFLVFSNFSMCLSYPKKIVGSTIPDECLLDRPRFRYKKVIVLMGANATGKTALGRTLMGIYNFVSKAESMAVTNLIDDRSKDASFVVDFAFSNHQLVRISAIFKARVGEKKDYGVDDIEVEVRSEKILAADSYETCLRRLLDADYTYSGNYIKELEKVPMLTWKFDYSIASEGKQRFNFKFNTDQYCSVLEKTLKALDPRIVKVKRLPDVEKTYAVHYPHFVVLLKDGEGVGIERLSSGTREGIDIAETITVMKLRICDFFYCDEKFSHIHAEAERAFLSVFIDSLGQNNQLFFTTHNADLLDMDLPKHTFAFLRRDEAHDNSVNCVFADEYLKKNTDSLKNAVENDVFSSSPNTDRIYGLSEMEVEG